MLEVLAEDLKENFHHPFIPVALQGRETLEPCAFAVRPLPGFVLQAQALQLVKNWWLEMNN